MLTSLFRTTRTYRAQPKANRQGCRLSYEITPATSGESVTDETSQPGPACC